MPLPLAETMLANRLASEAKELFEQGKDEEAGLVMFKVKLAQPRNKPLLRMMEDPVIRERVMRDTTCVGS